MNSVFQISNLDEIYQNFVRYKKNKQFCDVTLKVGDREISAHRIVLAASIPYFDAMFNGSFRENHESSIEIQGVDPDVLENLIDLSYGATINVTRENVEDLLFGADYFQMTHVALKMKEFMKTNLTTENVVTTKKTGEQLNCNLLVTAALEFIDDNFPAFYRTNDFLNLERDEVISIVRRPELRTCEETIYEAVMNWIKFSVFDRVDFLPEILSHVRMCLLRPEYLIDVVQNEILIKTSSECKDLLGEALNYQLLIGKRDIPRTIRSTPRNASSSMICVVGGKGRGMGYNNVVQIYDTMKNQWTIQENCNKVIASAATVVFEGKMYIFGGTSCDNLRKFFLTQSF